MRLNIESRSFFGTYLKRERRKKLSTGVSRNEESTLDKNSCLQKMEKKGFYGNEPDWLDVEVTGFKYLPFLQSKVTVHRKKFLGG